MPEKPEEVLPKQRRSAGVRLKMIADYEPYHEKARAGVMNQANTKGHPENNVIPFVRQSSVVVMKFQTRIYDAEYGDGNGPPDLAGSSRPASLPTAEDKPNQKSGGRSATKAMIKTKKETKVIQKESIFRREKKAMSFAPIWIGRK